MVCRFHRYYQGFFFKIKSSILLLFVLWQPKCDKQGQMCCKQNSSFRHHVKTLGAFEIITSVCWKTIERSPLLARLIYVCLQGLDKKTVQGLKGKCTSAWTTPDWCKTPPTDTNAAAAAHTCYRLHQIGNRSALNWIPLLYSGMDEFVC